jgi:hypothetical protein
MSASLEQAAEAAQAVAAAYHAAGSFDPKPEERAVTTLFEAGDWRQNLQLVAALEACKSARDLIKPEQDKLRALLAEAPDDVTRAAREFQISLVEWQLTRAADVAEKREKHLDAITAIEAEQERCRDSAHWFEYYAWTVDPRPDAPLAVMPLSPFEFQLRYLVWLDYITFEKRTSGVVEKSRDMGATEVTLRWMLHCWLYRRDYFGLVLSANEDLVDSKKDPGTLFEKLRFQMRLLPGWMLPVGFDLFKDMPFMQLANPATGSVLQGDAPTPNVGRQRRATFVLKDESAAWMNGGYQQHTALSRTANTICDVSSVQGKFNKFYELAHDGRTAKFEMDWRDHPWRDNRWYDSLPFGVVGPAMTQEEIAQEVDRNYEASQPGRVLKNVREEYCFITQDELVAGFSKFKLGHHFLTPGGRFRLPDEWNWGRVTDYGESAQREDDTHIWAYSLFARPAEGWPLSDSLFFFFSLPIEPIGATELEGFDFYSGLEREVGVRADRGFIREPEVNDMSHEATDPKEVLLEKCGDYWSIPDLDFDKGRRKLVFHFEVVDKLAVNPFRPELTGRSRIYFVAPEGEYFLSKNPRTGSHFVTPSQTQRGFKRLRKEIPSWHYPPEERGKPVPKMRPKSVFDDIITTVRYAVARWGVEAAPMTAEQRRLAQLPAELKPDAVMSQMGKPAFVELYTAQQHELQQILKREREREEADQQKMARILGGVPFDRGRARRR